MARLKNKTALVTGGGRGIGRAIVEKFHREGAGVMTCGRRSRPDDFPDDILWVTADVSKKEHVAGLKEAAAEKFGELDILVNNAGVQLEKTILDTTDQDWQALIDVNCKGVFLCCRDLMPIMARGGSIINISSISATSADYGLGLYNATKSFVQGLTRSIAVDHGDLVRCNAISPGWIMTNIADAAFAMADDPDAAKQDALNRHPCGRFGQPEDVANLALWLAGDEAEFATGQCYTLDGGLTAASPFNPKLS